MNGAYTSAAEYQANSEFFANFAPALQFEEGEVRSLICRSELFCSGGPLSENKKVTSVLFLVCLLQPLRRLLLTSFFYFPVLNDPLLSENTLGGQSLQPMLIAVFSVHTGVSLCSPRAPWRSVWCCHLRAECSEMSRALTPYWTPTLCSDAVSRKSAPMVRTLKMKRKFSFVLKALFLSKFCSTFRWECTTIAHTQLQAEGICCREVCGICADTLPMNRVFQQNVQRGRDRLFLC